MQRETRLLLSLLGIAFVLLSACTAPTSCPTSQPQAATDTPLALDGAAVLTPLPGSLPVMLAQDPSSPALVYYVIRDLSGKELYSAWQPPVVIYLPPGTYRWDAMAPIPSQPNWCYTVLEYLPYNLSSEFSVTDQPVLIQVRLGSRIAACTATPTP